MLLRSTATYVASHMQYRGIVMTMLIEGRYLLALGAVSLSSLMFGLEISSVPAILPTLEKVLDADFKDLQWVMNAYTIAVTTVLMATGTLADRYGRKRIFIGSILCFGLTSLACGLAAHAPMLIFARFLQGASGGAMLICQVAVLAHQFPSGPIRARAFGIWGVIFGMGLGFGPIIGTAIAALFAWQWVFLVHVVLALITTVLAAGGVSESRDPDAMSLDIFGIATLSLAVFCIAFYITQGSDFGYASAAGFGVLGIVGVSLIGFVMAERLAQRPMFDFSVFRIRAFSGAILGAAGMNFSFWPFMIYLPIYFQGVLGYGNVQSGLSLLAYTLPTLVIPPFAERLSLRFQAGLVIPVGLFLIGLGFVAMKLGAAADQPSWLTLLPGCLLAGIGLGFTNTPVTNATTASVPSTRAGMASGIDMSARMISLAINIALMGFILVAGVASILKDAGIAPHLVLDLAARLSVGDLGMAADAGLAQAALAGGFQWVMLYGALGAWLPAVASFAIFAPFRSAAKCRPA
jgi:EmrB/QacA subfamily drug resistance transporter